MAEIVNLRLARKAKQRQQASRQADENRARHGQSGAAREIARLDARRAERLLDGARRETED